ncbi:flagellar protein E [Haloferax sp. MBLA0076]|uniref:Flagellar protein E n=2 Tax=Haloferacaceae TaxID=1644056 RepID=A0A6A8GJ12_9EURY|nr:MULTISPECIES: flagella accessory protein C [Haloferax]KAB1194561.1 flagellar protein E [Haloferax sp. CBA1148]MRX23135.1 flagellar protein E [Haloferax litoreum]
MSSDDGLGFEEGIDDLSDEFGDFGDDLDDGFDDDDFGGFDGGNNEELAELEDRVGELENEVSAISSGMNTVREENKQIGETVEELEDTIRKLLDIYEMVTRGINPFVDDAREMGGLDGGGSFGLFEAEAEDEEHLDPEVANAEAETFFDDDFGELDAETGEKEAELAAEDELTDAERQSPAEALDDDFSEETDEDDDSDAGTAGGASFDDLKQEYEESGGWDDEEEEEAAEEAEEAAELEEPALAEDTLDELEDDPADDAGELDEQVEEVTDEPEDESDDLEKTLDELEAEYASAAMAKEELTESDEEDDSDASATIDEPTESVEEPFEPVVVESNAYLTQLPASYVSEVLVLEWAEHLVSVGGALGASRALRQYREQEWISRHVENELNAHVGQIAAAMDSEEDTELRIEDHQTSLAYVSRLAEGVPAGRLFEELVAYGGEIDGIRC